MAVVAKPFPPGDYDVVVVGSGPGGLQTSYDLRTLGVRHAVLSADEAPAGMFQRFPVFERLITWTKGDAPFERGTREYEWYDHNSLLADEPESRALVPQLMDRTYDVPSRQEMEAGLAAFAERTGLEIRYGCRWEATRREEDGLVLQTSDGEYRCRAAVFAIGVTEPWKAPIPGVEHARHYVDTGSPEDYRGGRVFIVGKRNSGFEVATGLLPWASELVLASPRPVDTARLGRLAVRARYLNPLDEYSRGGAGALVVDAAIERIERRGDAFRITARGTTWPGELTFEADHVLVATGFRTPLLDLPDLGLATVSDGRVPGADAVLRKRVRSGRVLRRATPRRARLGCASRGSRATPPRSTGSGTTRASSRGTWPRRGSASSSSGRRSSGTRCSRISSASSPTRPSSGSRRATSRAWSAATARSATRGSSRSSTSSTSEGRTLLPWRSRWIARGRSIPPRTSGSPVAWKSTRCRRIPPVCSRATRTDASSPRCSI